MHFHCFSVVFFIIKSRAKPRLLLRLLSADWTESKIKTDDVLLHISDKGTIKHGFITVSLQLKLLYLILNWSRDTKMCYFSGPHSSQTYLLHLTSNFFTGMHVFMTFRKSVIMAMYKNINSLPLQEWLKGFERGFFLHFFIFIKFSFSNTVQGWNYDFIPRLERKTKSGIGPLKCVAVLLLLVSLNSSKRINPCFIFDILFIKCYKFSHKITFRASYKQNISDLIIVLSWFSLNGFFCAW